MSVQHTGETATVYVVLRHRAREIAARLPMPDFYNIHAAEVRQAQESLDGHPLLIRLTALVADQIENDFGHGLAHARKVAVDAGALILVESREFGLAEDEIARRQILAQTAGLLHDMRRREKQHAIAGARNAERILRRLKRPADEIEAVSYAIANHEAFQRIQAPPSALAGMVSDCLYDSDKFRWGPDNFTDTLWDMVAYFNPPLSAFVERYPGGMQKLEEIKATFRSLTGRRFGPQMINFGIAIGRELMTIIRTEFTHLL
jgi:hypothetical protein